MKNKILFLVCCLLFCFSLQVNADEIKYKSVDDFVKTLGSDAKVEFQANGDLNADKLDDWAGIILREKGNFKTTEQLYILLKTTDNAFVLTEKSLESESNSAGNVYIDGLEIKRDGLFIFVNSKSGSYRTTETAQIKLYNRLWRLVGLNKFDISMENQDELTKTDSNLLTGDVIITKQKGERKRYLKQQKTPQSARYLKDYNLFENSVFNISPN